MNRADLTPHGAVHLTVLGPDGKRTAERSGTNTVVGGGRSLLAQLLTGAATHPQFKATIGIEGAPTLPDLTKLLQPDGIQPQPVTEVQAKDGTISLKATFPAADKDRQIAETGLMLACTIDANLSETLYNRALVQPALPLRSGEVLTLTWTLSFTAPGAS
ncbi:MAG TPA: hypothetical protein VK191_00055 [Symbiobacteriaceae bacterium]|nr:hypothetical protein [Symbiobacteriaceae bacterium]